jgi:hypothetical protein
VKRVVQRLQYVKITCGVGYKVRCSTGEAGKTGRALETT